MKPPSTELSDFVAIKLLGPGFPLILAGRPWPASEAPAANHHHGDSFGAQYRLESNPDSCGKLKSFNLGLR